MFTVYSLLDPDTLLIRYIGVTKDVKRRRREHTDAYYLEKYTHSRYKFWQQKLQREGKSPIFAVLGQYPNLDSAYHAEKTWIAIAKESGFDLVNWDEGGRHCMTTRKVTWIKKGGSSYLRTEEWKRAAGLRQKKWFADHPLTDEQRAAISAERRTRRYGPYSQERRNGIARAHMARTVIDLSQFDLSVLDERETKVVLARFGSDEVRTRTEIAESLGLSWNQARWAERTALKKLGLAKTKAA